MRGDAERGAVEHPAAQSWAPGLLAAAASLAPHRVAHRTLDGPALTYGDWHAQSIRLGHVLEASVAPGDRVLVVSSLSSWPAHAVAYIGVQRAGAIPVLVSSTSSPDELSDAARAVGAALALTGEREAIPSLTAAGLEVAIVGEPSDEALAARARSDDRPPHPVADIIFTTGTTGTPKPVVTTHENLMRGTGRAPRSWEGRQVVHTMPPFAASGAQGVTMLALTGRLRCISVPPFGIGALLRTIDEHGATILWTSPSILTLIADSNEADARAFGRLAHVFSVGAPLSPRVLERVARKLPRTRLINVYGLTEAGGAQTVMVYDPARPASVGRASPLTEIEIRADDGTRLERGEVGEIWLRKRGVPPRSYFRDPKATRAVFREGWTRSGDLGYVDAAGYLYVVDRKKNVIITDGQNVSAAEVESVLVQHPDVADAAVVGVSDRLRGERVAAVVVSRSDDVSARELRRFCRERLSAFKTPAAFFRAAELPRTETGKVLHAKLRAELLEQRLPRLGG